MAINLGLHNMIFTEVKNVLSIFFSIKNYSSLRNIWKWWELEVHEVISHSLPHSCSLAQEGVSTLLPTLLLILLSTLHSPASVVSSSTFHYTATGLPYTTPITASHIHIDVHCLR